MPKSDDPMMPPVGDDELREDDELLAHAMKRLIRVRTGESTPSVYRTKSYVSGRIAWRNDVDFVISQFEEMGYHLTEAEFKKEFDDEIDAETARTTDHDP